MADDGRRRPRRAERARRRRPLRRRAPRRSPRCTASRTRPSRARRDGSHWDILASTARRSTGCARRAPTRGPVDSSASTRGRSTSASSTRPAQLVATPSTTATRAAPARSTRVLAKVPARELYERTGIQIMPINTIFELAAMAAERRRRRSRGAETLLMIPDLVPPLARRHARGEYTNATTTQCLDARAAPGRTTCSSASTSRRGSCPSSSRPATVLGPLHADVADETGLGGARVVAVATHDTASAVAAIPFRHAGSAYISAGTWSLVGVELRPAADRRRSLRREPDERGRRRRHFRLLRNVTGLWLLHECRRAWAGRGLRLTRSTSWSRSPTTRRRCGSLIEPNDPVFAAPGDMPRADPRVLRRDRPGRARRSPRRGRALHPREPRAEARQTVDAARAPSPEPHPTEIHIVGGGARNALLCRWTARRCRPAGARRPRGGDAARQPARAGDRARRDRLARRGAARSCGRSFAPAVCEPSRLAAPWHEARQRFAGAR